MRQHDAHADASASVRTQMPEPDAYAMHGRTDGLTHKPLTHRDQSHPPNRARAYEDFDFPGSGSAACLTFVDVVDQEFDALFEPRERWPLERTGRREPIDPAARQLISERDGGTCRWCGSPFDAQLDHVVPWSAYGSDTSDNLRVLCRDCNLDRSNYADPAARAAVPVARWCYWCARSWWENVGELDPEWSDPVDPADRISAYCGACGGTSWVPDRSWLL